jgi:hypothetical protein
VTRATQATIPVLRALLDEARRGDYRSGVLGVRARPEWNGAATFLHDGVPVAVVPCVSTLAVREALLDRPPASWLVVLTDREPDDLGAGVLSHLLWHRLRRPDPWEAVRHRFAATGLDPALTTGAGSTEVAAGLLAAAPPAGWPPAPGGILTRDHALASVASAHLGLGEPPVDALSVLAWTGDPAAVARAATLRELAGDGLTDAVLAWASSWVGPAGDIVGRLLRDGRTPDVLPLGLALGVLADAMGSPSADEVMATRAALIRLEPTTGPVEVALAAARSWAPDTRVVVASLFRDPATRSSAERVLARSDQVLGDIDAARLTGRSDLLPSGLTRRLGALADTLRTAVGASGPGRLMPVESAWAQVGDHHLSADDRRVPAFHAAVRLMRWLGSDDPPLSSLPELACRQSRSDGWVDAAVNDAGPGVGESDLGAALAAVLHTVQVRRDRHDVQFAQALASYTAAEGHSVLHLERVLPEVVLPLAQSTPVLFLLLDGMSVGVSTEVLADVLRNATDGWAEALLAGEAGRAFALSALPSLTEVSRASLFCGSLTRGGQDTETKGLAALATAYGLTAVLFHKKPLDSSRPGFAVADDVGAAIDDTGGTKLVSCVLNTIDDALDRSDPGGTAWGAETVRNLAPLLERARHAGRTVVLTADHGHIVERRQGTMRAYAGISSGRSRDLSAPAVDGEIAVSGSRVLTPDHRAVLAVDERVRFGPLKAGYHGGAAPAEVVVPLAVLVPGAPPEGSALRLAPPQQPDWWDGPLPATADPLGVAIAPPPAHGTLSLFDAAAPPDEGGLLVSAVLASDTYQAQKALAPRLALSDDQIAGLLSALVAAPAQRLTSAQTAQALGVASLAVRGAVPQAQALLNVDGYAVLRVDSDGTTLVLDESLLREQFEVGR